MNIMLDPKEQERFCAARRAVIEKDFSRLNPEQRKAVSDALISLVTAGDGQDDMGAILKATQQNALRRAADSKPKTMDNDELQAMYDSLNPHRRKETE